MSDPCNAREIPEDDFDALLRSITISSKEQARLNRLAQRMRKRSAVVLEANTASVRDLI